MNRRQAIHCLGLGAAGLCLAPRASIARRPIAAPRLTDLAARIRDTPATAILDLAADAIGRGAQPADLLGATFLAGVLDVRPRPVGGNLHSVMTVEASFRLVETAPSHRSAWLVALWNLDAFKATQQERGDPWVLPPAPAVSFASEAAARRELVAALETWDEGRADRAVVGLLPFHDRRSLYEVLWPYTVRCMAYLGHKVVYGAMTEAVLGRIGWEHAEPTVRSLVYGLVGPGRDRPITRAFEHAVAVETAFPAGWLDHRHAAPAESASMLRALLAGSYQDAQRTVIEAARAGLDTRTIWDAVRLAASELWLRRKSNDPRSGAAIRAAHAVTEIWSLGHAWRATGLERSKRLLLLQAAAWIPELRDALLVRDAISMDGPGIDRLGPSRDDLPTTIEELLEHGSAAAARGFLDRHPAQASAFLAQLRRQLGAKGLEYHQFKYAVALADETSAADPRWSSRLLAPAVGYLPTAGADDNELTGRAHHALDKAGVGPA